MLPPPTMNLDSYTKLNPYFEDKEANIGTTKTEMAGIYGAAFAVTAFFGSIWVWARFY